MKKILVFSLIFLNFTANAQLKFANIFGDHMVLQRNKAIHIWGFNTPETAVKISFKGAEKTIKTDASGKWEVEFEATSAGGPYELTATDENESLKITDILVGEVWLCSGQSNMEWRLKQANNAQTEIPKANFPEIRQFEVPHLMSFKPEKDLPEGSWKVCNPENAADFSAVAYFFAKEISQKLKVPVGLIHSSWGGSQVESWISKSAMENSEVLKYYPSLLAKNWDEDAQKWERKLIFQSFGDQKIDISKIKETDYLAPGYDFSKWKLKIRPNGQWDWKGIWAFRGSAYLHRKLNMPLAWVSKTMTFNFGKNTGDFEMYINGKLINKAIYRNQVLCTIAPGTLKEGTNDILIKTSQNQDPSWWGMGFVGNESDFYLNSDLGQIPLLEIDWEMMPSFQSPRNYEHWMNNQGTILYNAMIAPIVGYGIQGALWYQGESNAGRAYQYRESFPLMIKNWRQDWRDDFAFYFVQLSSYGPQQSSNEGSSWAELREAQTMTLKLPKTGMAVTTDIGNPNDIHPTNKKDVGYRLALQALKTTYNQKVVASGPEYLSHKIQGNQLVISFKTEDSRLQTNDKYGYLKGFEIAGADKKFYFAKAEIKGNTVILSSNNVSKPLAARYAWSDSPVEANLFNDQGLPAVPFRTDTWPGLTEKVEFER